jgi:hypothetical protein
MIVVPLGKIACVTPGTPVRVTATFTPCYGLIVTPVLANAGKTYFGVLGMVKATGVGVTQQFLTPAATGLADRLLIHGPDGNQMNAADYYIDADTAADGLLVSYISE